MSPLSRRAFAAAALTTLLAGCGGPGDTGDTAGRAATGSRPSATSSATPSSAKSAAPQGRSVPVRLAIPEIGVDTPVIRLGLAKDGTVQVPPITAHDRAGWYEHSPTPGQTGPSVILGHVSVGSYGDGVFRRLGELRRGDRVEARLENGRTAGFAVTEVRTVDKADFPAEAVYGNVDRPELRLITCGGPRTGAGYRDNVIVFAAADSASSAAGER